MQICILGFKGSHAADDAYAEVLELEGEDHRWLLEVGTMARPRVGRVRVGVTFPDGETAVGSSRVDLQACKLEYSIVSPK